MAIMHEEIFGPVLPIQIIDDLDEAIALSNDCEYGLTSSVYKDDQQLLGLINHSWLESSGVYGYRKSHDDVREFGESWGRPRVARLMRLEGTLPI